MPDLIFKAAQLRRVHYGDGELFCATTPGLG